MDSRNQIDIVMDIEEILIKCGLEYAMAYNPDEDTYYFKLTNKEVKGE